MEFLKAKDGKLYLTFPRKRRVGQIILQHSEEGEEPLWVDGVKLDRNLLIERLLIGRDDFERLVGEGKIWPLLNIPLYSRDYYGGIPFNGVRKRPIDFDFIQIQGRALIYADGDSVRLIGSIDGLSAFLLVKSGLVISPDVVILAIEYATRHGLSLPEVDNPLVRFYNILKKTVPDVVIEGVEKDGNVYIIKTSIGDVYYDGKRLANTLDALKVIKKLPVVEGYIEERDGSYVLHSFVLKDDAVVDFIVLEDGTLELFLPSGERVVLDAKVSLKDGVIRSASRQRVRFKKEYTHVSVNRFFISPDGVKAESTVVIEGRKHRIVEDADVMEMTDELEFDGDETVPFGEVLSRSELIRSFNFNGDGLKYAFFTLGDRSFIAVYGGGGAGIRGVFDRTRQHFLINDGLNTRVYRVIRLDRFDGSLKVSGEIDNIDEFVRLVELNLASKVYPLAVHVELGDDVFINIRSPFGKFTFSYSRTAFRRLKAKMRLGGVRFGISEFSLPTDGEGVRVYTVSFEQRDYVGWVVGKPVSGRADIELRRKYVFWGGVFSYEKRRIRPLGFPEDFRPKGEFCFSDLYKRTVCVPVSKQRTLF